MPDPAPGIQAKQRSVHNTYFTLPVLFVMTSNHFAMTYGHEYNWAYPDRHLAGGRVDSYLLRSSAQRQRIAGQSWWLPSFLLAIASAIAPQPKEPSDTGASFDQVRNVIDARCTSCHSSTPLHPAFPVAPLGIMFDR